MGPRGRGRSAEHPSAVTAWDRSIIVPFAPESSASGIDDRTLGPDLWYRRTIDYTRRDDIRLLLHFGAVDYEAQVWVDGRFVGRHEGGFTPFTFDITDALKDRSAHEIAVWAHDEPAGPRAAPRQAGLADEPHSIWYPRTTGIWQTVWLEEVPRRRLSDVRLAPQLERWATCVEAQLQDADPSVRLQLRLRLSVGDRVIADDQYRVTETRSTAPSRWRTRHRRLPQRAAVVARVADADPRRGLAARRRRGDRRGALVHGDARGRSAARADPAEQPPVSLRLVLDQGYWPDTLMTPPDEEALIRDIELAKAAGFNGVRKHQKIEDPRFLYWADVLGLLVWEEMPSAYRFTPSRSSGSHASGWR